MKCQFSNLSIGIIILLMFFENCHSHYFRRLIGRRLTSNEISRKNFDDIRNIVSASLTANEPDAEINDVKKREVSNDQSEDKDSMEIESEDNGNVASESKDSAMYEDEVEENDDRQQQQQEQRVRQVDDEESKRSPSAMDERVEKSVDQSELSNDDEVDLKNAKDVTKRETRNEEDYEDEDMESNADIADGMIATDQKSNDAVRSALDEVKPEGDVEKSENTRDAATVLEASDLDYEKQIEDQIQQKIDSIKEDINRKIERKQQAREIEANNAKYDELEFPRDEDDVEIEKSLDSSKRSVSPNAEVSNASGNAGLNVRSKRGSELETDSEDTKKMVLPVKKRSYARQVTLVEKRDDPRRKARSSVLLIPERSHAEVKDDLPSDLTLDPNLRIARSNEKEENPEKSRSIRSAPRSRNDYSAGRYRRDMSDEQEDQSNQVNDAPEESEHFLFSAREKSNPRNRRRRGRGRDRARSLDRAKSRNHPRHLRRHRAIRESPMEDSEQAEERDKRAMSLDEDAVLEYKESFGGFQSDSGGALGRFKRIKRSAKIS